MEIRATSQSYLPWWISQSRTLVCKVGDAVPPAICGPHHYGVPVNRQRYKDYVFKDAHVSHDIVCDIWGTAELQANNILISFFGLNVFSGGCSWWRHLTRLLNYLSTASERETPCKIYWGQEKERCGKRQSWQTEGVMNEKTERDKSLHSNWMTWDLVHTRAVWYWHTHWGPSSPCVKQRQRSPMRFHLSRWFTAPVRYIQWKKNKKTGPRWWNIS